MQFLGLHWGNPLWLLLLPMLLLLCAICFKQRQAQNHWQKVCDAHLLAHLMVGQKDKKQQWPWLLLALAWILTSIALAEPSWQKQTIPTYRKQQAYIIIFDTSNAMNSDDITPSRLVRARYKTIDILQHLKPYQVGLLAFSGESYVVSPITGDSHTIEHLIRELSPNIIPVPGYQLSMALTQAQQLFQQTDIKQGKILVITAGPVTEKTLKIAETLHDEGIEISVLALGSKQGAPIKTLSGEYSKDQHGNIIISRRDTQGLTKLANVGGGRYANFTADDKDIQKLLPHVGDSIGELHAIQSNQIIDWKNQGYLLIYPLLLITLLGFRRGWLHEILMRN